MNSDQEDSTMDEEQTVSSENEKNIDNDMLKKEADNGIKAMIDRALDTYEKLPMLDVVFDKFVRLLATSLRNLTENNVEAQIKSIQSLRFGTYLDSIPVPSLVVIFKALEWDNLGILITDNALNFSLVENLFGGKHNQSPTKIEDRPYTTIEQAIVKQIANIVFKDLSSSFESISPVNLKFERLETDPRFASIARRADSAVLIQIELSIENKKGNLEILLPYETLEPVRELLLQVFIGEKFGSADAQWESNLLKKIKKTSLTLEAVLKGRPTKMQDIIELKIGSTIMMENTFDSDVVLSCKGREILSGKVGRVGNKVAVSLNESANDYRKLKEKNL